MVYIYTSLSHRFVSEDKIRSPDCCIRIPIIREYNRPTLSSFLSLVMLILARVTSIYMVPYSYKYTGNNRCGDLCIRTRPRGSESHNDITSWSKSVNSYGLIAYDKESIKILIASHANGIESSNANLRVKEKSLTYPPPVP